MSIVLIKTVDGEDTKDYYSGDPSKCPPIPAVGHFIEGTFGSGKVIKVEHIVDASQYAIKLHFLSNAERTYEHTGF